MTVSDPDDAHKRLSISEVARLAGVTTRTVRHYHAEGLLPEPARDSSGYRRYGARDVVELVRVVRLRSLGMPLRQIAERLSADGADGASLTSALRGLAAEMDSEIDELVRTRDTLLRMADDDTFDQPVRALTEALRGSGLLGPADELRAGETWAASLLDALHPQGMPGVLDEARDLLDDSAALVVLRRRFRKLSKDASDDEIGRLADDVAGALPTALDGAKLIDMDVLDKLLAGRMNQAQQRFMHRLRSRLDDRRHAPNPPE